MYPLIKQRINSSIDSLDQVRSALTAAAEKKSSTRILELLKTLFMMQSINTTLVEAFVNLYPIDDKKIHRTIHYFLFELSKLSGYQKTPDNSSLKTGIINHLKETLKTANKLNTPDRKVLAMKSLGAIATDQVFESVFNELANTLMDRSDAKESEKTKKSAGLTFFGAKDKDKDNSLERSLLQYALFSALRQRPSIPPSMRNAVMFGVFNCEEPIGTRHAMSLAYKISLESPGEVAHGFQVAWTAKDQSFLTSDTLTRVYFTKICANLAGQKVDYHSEIFRTLCNSVQDNNRVAFEAMVGLARCSWKKLLTATLLSEEGDQISLLGFVIDRLVDAMRSGTKLPILHSAARTMATMAEEYIKQSASFEADSMQPLTMVLSPLMGPLQSLIDSPQSSVYVRLKAIKAFVWITSANDTQLLCNIFCDELRIDRFPSNLFDELYEELHRRVQMTPEFAPAALNLVYNWFHFLPEKVNTDIICEIWNTIVEVSRRQVLENIFRILDRIHQPKTRLTTYQVHKKVYWYLGEKALVLSGQLNRSPPTTGAPATPAPQPFKPAIISSKKIETKVEPQVIHIDVDNPALKAIVLRLENAVKFMTWEIRVVALEALSKIACVCTFPLKTYLYEFFATCLEDPSLCLNSTVVPIISTLNAIFASKKKWTDIKEHKNLTSEERTIASSTFNMENAALVSEILLFTNNLPIDDFCPIEPEQPKSKFRIY